MEAKRLTEEQRSNIRKEYREGASVASLSRSYGFSRTAIRYQLDKHNIPRRGRQTKSLQPIAERIIADYPFLSQEKIAKKYDTTQAMISRLLRSFGLGKPWRPIRYIDHGGYTVISIPHYDPLYSMSRVAGRILEHRYVMAQKLGRPLTNEETVHHINGNKQDNRPENLQLRHGNHGTGVTYQCIDCKSFNIAPVLMH